MKKLLFAMTAFAAISFASCGSKTETAPVASDSDSVVVDSTSSDSTDSVVVDSVSADTLK